MAGLREDMFSSFAEKSKTINPRPVEYRLVKGSPLDVELGVNELIEKGFVLNGTIMEYVLPNSTTKIFVQAMVKYEDRNT